MWPPPQKVDILDSFGEIFVLCVSHSLTHELWFLSDPAYVVAPVLQSQSGREDLKKLFAGFLLNPLSSFSIH